MQLMGWLAFHPMIPKMQETAYSQLNMEPKFTCNMEGPSSSSPSFADVDGMRTSCSYVEMSIGVRASGLESSGPLEWPMEGPSYLTKATPRMEEQLKPASCLIK